MARNTGGIDALRSLGCRTPLPRRGPEGRPSCYTVTMDDLLSRITIDPDICHGKPTVRGLRYPVETLLELLSSGMTFEDVLADYEDLDRDDLRAVLAFAARSRPHPSAPAGIAVRFVVDAQLPRRLVGWLAR